MDPDHRDDGSLLTMSVMLSEPGECTGGEFVAIQGDGAGERNVVHLNKGDAVVFASLMRHNVQTVVQGSRRSLVVELWDKGANVYNRYR